MSTTKVLPANTPPLAALRAFEATARLGSLSRAALELHVTKSAVSHQIRALEADFGITLLRRGGTVRQAEVTAAGTELLATVQQALTMLESACRDLRTATKKQPRYHLNLSANQSVAMLWLAPRLNRFVEAHPDIALQVHLHVNQNPAWKAQDIDIALLHVRDDGPHLPKPGDVPLMAETIVPVCSPTLVAPCLRDDPQTLSRFRWLEEKHVSSPETSWRTWQQRLGLQGPAEPGMLALSGMGTVVSAAIAGLGIALGRIPLVDEDIACRRLVPLVPDLCIPGSWRYVARIRPGRTHDAILSALVTFLIEEGSQPASYR